ncbi:hypothetical protein PHYPSEUDO_012659 [Phytophthora pseudosyringae]|uniref:Uncharacterized protein n=1 Tax=Phytophthora pseudosyringae TaxID=221518 RepID=A0A8T1V9R8_9STRA|nr:hypothetical protein PHYPSEUDO_012659 [Phytophthora pseudosyringae]
MFVSTCGPTSSVSADTWRTLGSIVSKQDQRVGRGLHDRLGGLQEVPPRRSGDTVPAADPAASLEEAQRDSGEMQLASGGNCEVAWSPMENLLQATCAEGANTLLSGA